MVQRKKALLLEFDGKVWCLASRLNNEDLGLDDEMMEFIMREATVFIHVSHSILFFVLLLSVDCC